ncbi:endonuclease domain-containing protein [Klenkia brasiliensis]|uniref:T/G mismatch-specific endonuclease n=1 Tax=Klenkia brasiliensis TaxID=333142 RepID=A0A1G7R9L0_9ACTN|nr:endonuclease domain-containing protein [Klenkia brasiliensis]SDG07491.1 T/G mismatch-specific endonuclease [Klenkia brasiliensis]
MPTAPAVPPALAGRVFRGSDAVGRGLLTAAQLRSSAWRRLRQDVYVDASVPLTHRVRVAGVRLVMPAGAAFADLTAASLWGVPDLVGVDDPVDVVVPPGERWTPSSDVRARTAEVAGEVVLRGGAPVTSRVRTAVDLARRPGPPDERVVLVDRLVAGRLVGLPDLRSAVHSLPRCRGSAGARLAVDLADGLAESPQETRTRLHLRRGGVPAPVAQFCVLQDGRFVARVDFAWPDRKVALEYDGLWHAEPGRFAKDRARLNALQAAGWRVVFVTARDLHHPAELVARVLAVLAA